MRMADVCAKSRSTATNGEGVRAADRSPHAVCSAPYQGRCMQASTWMDKCSRREAVDYGRWQGHMGSCPQQHDSHGCNAVRESRTVLWTWERDVRQTFCSADGTGNMMVDARANVRVVAVMGEERKATVR